MRARTAVNAAIGLLCATQAAAGPLPPIAFLAMGYAEARLADMAGTPGYQQRLADPAGYLAVSADFNGDGRVDEGRVLLNRQRGDARVVAVIVSADRVDTYVLRSMPIAAAAGVGIRVAPAGRAGAAGSGALPGLEIFALGSGETEANYFSGEQFVVRPAEAARSLE